MLKKEQIMSQQCYICSSFFTDKVKLGIHIARCYDDALSRGESWHPHPDILLDDVRYSQYMLSADRDKMFKDAERKKVAFASADEFAALQSQIGSRGGGGGSPNINKRGGGGGGFSLPSPTTASPKHNSPPSPPKYVPTSTYQTDFANANAAGGRSPRGKLSAAAGVSSEGGRATTPRGTPIDNVPGGRQQQQQQQQQYSSPPKQYSSPPQPQQPQPQPQVQFAQPGVNTLRSELQSELAKVKTFMSEERRRAQERDAALANLVDGASTAMSHVAARGGGGGGSGSSSPSYHQQQREHQHEQHQSLPPIGSNYNSNASPPRPAIRLSGYGNEVLAPVPTSGSGRNSHNTNLLNGGGFGIAPSSPPRGLPVRSQQPSGVRPSLTKEQEAVNNELTTSGVIHGGGFEAGVGVERVPCGKCGRMFAPARVDEHEEVCVSKPKGIHRR